MTLIEVENLSAAQLKERRAELIEAIKGADPVELATRFVDARHDAKLRDERLGEQGETINALKQGLGAATQRAAEQEGMLAAASKRIKDGDALMDQMTADLAAVKAEASKAIEGVKAALKAEQAKSARLTAQLRQREAAVNTAAKALNDAIAARLVETAEQG